MVFIPFAIQKMTIHRSFSAALSHLIYALPLRPTYTPLIVLQRSSVTASYQNPHIPSSKPRVHFLLLGPFQMVCSSPATCVTFRNLLFLCFCGEQLLAPRPNKQPGGPPLLGRPRTFIPATLHIWEPSPPSVTWWSTTPRCRYIQGPAEISDDLVTQLWVEPLSWGICPWALF